MKNFIHTMIQVELNKLAKANPFPSEAPGDITLQTTREELECYGDHLEGDLGIYYDYCNDDLRVDTRNTDNNKWIEWFDSLFWSENSIDAIMLKFGYELVDEQDGSGGGLWYGGRIYRPKFGN